MFAIYFLFVPTFFIYSFFYSILCALLLCISLVSFTVFGAYTFSRFLFLFISLFHRIYGNWFFFIAFTDYTLRHVFIYIYRTYTPNRWYCFRTVLLFSIESNAVTKPKTTLIKYPKEDQSELNEYCAKKKSIKMFYYSLELLSFMQYTPCEEHSREYFS